jgi:hypothetical protein
MYEEASGQEINLAKSEVFFSRNLSMAAQEDLSKIMGVRHVLGTGNYLGLPSMIGRKKKEIFAYIKDRIWKRINAWRGRMLSRAGKEVMIKSVLQAIPSYIMSIYIIPSTTITEIERMVNSFWWSGGNNNTGIRWLAWDKLTTPKAMGGMGFRDFQAFNMAMVAKQGWRLLQNPDALVSRVLKARYFPKTSFINSKLGNNPSYAWKSLWMCREVLGKGCRWVVGDGRSVRVMADPWVRGGESWWVSSPQKEEVYDMTVNQLLVEGEKRWDVQKVKYLFNDEMVEKILSMNICQDVREDKLIWEGEKNGLYTVRAGYRSIMSEAWSRRDTSSNKNWLALWNINAPPKTKHLIWRVCKGCIPTRNHLLQHHVDCGENCPLCTEHVENEFHIFFTCPRVLPCWEAAGLSSVILQRVHSFNNAADLLFDICSNADSDIAGRVASLLWHIWQSRNDVVWNHTQLAPVQIGLQAFNAWQAWYAANNSQSADHHEAQNNNYPRWKKPSEGWIKLNVDAAFFRDQNKTSTACCVRRDDGSFLCAQTCSFSLVPTALEGEALALLEATKLAVHKGWDHVVFESDSQTLVHSTVNNNSGLSEFSAIVSSIKHNLSLLSNFEVKFVRRQANTVAHSLARASVSWASHRFFNVVPPCIDSLVINEMS